MILRTAEAFQIPVTIYDAHEVIQGSRIGTIADFGCGALGRTPPFVTESAAIALDRAPGRLIATAADGSRPATGFDWWEDDCLILGNEYDGLPSSVTSRADETLRISLPPAHLPKPKSISPIEPARTSAIPNDGLPTLNVAAVAAILLAARREWFTTAAPKQERIN